MKSIYRQLFLAVFSLLVVAAFASGWITTEAATGTSRSAASNPSTVLLTENFDYTAGSLLTANNWTAHNASGTNSITVTSPGLSYPGYAGSGVGNAVTMAANGEDTNRSLSAPATTGSVYTAFLVNVATTTATGDYFFHYQVNATTFWGRVWARKDAVANTFSFGLSRSSTPAGGDPVFTTATYQPGTTYLVVLKYTFNDGANNDAVSLFVNPTPGASEPLPTLTSGDFLLADPSSLAGIGIRQGGASTGSTQQVDGIRVATSWEEAVASGTPASEPTGKVDLNGDGRTDYLVVRPQAGLPTAGLAESRKKLGKAVRQRTRNRADAMNNNLQGGSDPLQWWGLNSSDYGVFTAYWGESQGDEPLTADFDGDGKDDIAVWRPVPEGAYFFSLNSSDFTLRQVGSGQADDNPYVVADYDGDGADDPAIYRCPFDAPGTCIFVYRPSSIPNAGDYVVPWGYGQGTDWIPYAGDFNGDGLADFAVQGASPSNPENGVFYVTINGVYDFASYEWGLFFDRPVSGDFDGDGKSDIAVTRIDDNDVLWWYIYEIDGGGVKIVPWGDAFDFEAQGDYDGDGIDDIATYRWNTNDATFWVLPSNGDPYLSVNWGQPGDYPLAFFVQ